MSLWDRDAGIASGKSRNTRFQLISTRLVQSTVKQMIVIQLVNSEGKTENIEMKRMLSVSQYICNGLENAIGIGIN